MGIINQILAPAFLTSRIGMIALLLGSVVLVIFSDIVLRNIIFPVADFVKEATHAKLLGYRSSERFRIFARIFSESLATAIFLVYCYIGTSILASYFFEPLLIKMQSFILLPVMILFILISYSINNFSMRRNFFDCVKNS